MKGVIKRVVYPAGKRLVGKERGEWMKLTDEEAELVEAFRAYHAARSAAHDRILEEIRTIA